MQNKRFAIDLMNAVADYCDEQAKTLKDARADKYARISERLTELVVKIAVEETGDRHV